VKYLYFFNYLLIYFQNSNIWQWTSVDQNVIFTVLAKAIISTYNNIIIGYLSIISNITEVDYSIGLGQYW